MAKKKAVKVRKWVTCAEPGCKRRARTSQPYCGEHQKKFEKEKAAAAKKRKKKPTKREVYLKRKEKEEKKKQKQTKKYSKAVDQARQMVDAAAKKKKKIASSGLIKDPGSRLLKAHCEKCNYTIRLSRKWIEVRRPLCPVCMRNMVTELDGLIDADPRQLKLKGTTSKRRKGRADPDAAKKIGEALKGGV